MDNEQNTGDVPARKNRPKRLSHVAGRVPTNWQDYVSMVRDYWYFGLIVGAIVAAAFAYNKFQEVPLYRSSATVLFEIDRDRVLNIEEVRDTSIRRNPDSILRSHMVDLRSNSFRRKVVDSLSDEERELIVRPYRVNGASPSIHGIIAGANRIRQMQANIFSMEFHHRDPQAAALLSNRFVEVFDRELQRRGREGNDAAIRFLRTQSEELRLRVERGELAVQRYRQDRDLVSLEESQNLVLERLKSISGSLNQAKVALLDLDTRVRQVDAAIADDTDPSRLPFIAQHPLVAGRLEDKRALQRERDLMGLRYGERHPSMIANATALEVAGRQLADGIRFAVENLREEHSSQKARVESLTVALSNAEREALELDQVAIEYNVLRRKLAADQALFAQVHKRLNEAVLASQLASANMRIVDSAGVPGTPFTPDERKIITTALGLFSLCFVGLPIGWGILRARLKTATEVELYLGKPFLGDVHRFSRSKVKQMGRLVLDRLHPVGNEQFRVLYSQLTIQSNAQTNRTYVISSLIPKEGKSFIAANLAATFCRHHHRVLLIDGDLRRPSLHKGLGVTNARGIIKWYKEHESADDDLNFTNLGLIPVADNFDLIPAGGSTNEPTEIIQSNAFLRLLNYLKTVYEIVIIDTPPAGVFSDALCFGEMADNYVLVTQQNKHPRTVIRSVVRQLDASNAEVAGVLFNQLSPRKSKRLGTRYYHYSKYASKYYDVDAAEEEAGEQASNKDPASTRKS